MKKFFTILKILIITVLIFLCAVFSYYYVNIEKVYLSEILNLNTVYTVVTPPIYTETQTSENKFALIYFYQEETLQKEKHDQLLEFISTTKCKDIVNFVDYKIDTKKIENYIVYKNITQDTGSNSIVLLNKKGSIIATFNPTDDVSIIENEIKQLLKNFV